MKTEKIIDTDVLVIGGGMAGIFAAIKAREAGAKVSLVDKNYVGRTGATAYAEGCYSVFNPEWGDDIKKWTGWLNAAGEYMDHPQWAEASIKDSYDRFRDLVSWGVGYDKKENGEPVRYKVAEIGFGCLENCVLQRGYQFTPQLRNQAEKIGVSIIDRVMVADLLKTDGAVTGAIGFHVRSGDILIFKARAIVMATGNGTFKDVPGTMGVVGFLSYDGEAMAYRAGAEIGGKEFASAGAAYFDFGKNEETRISLEGKKIDYTPGIYPNWVSYGPHISYMNSYVDAEGYTSHRIAALEAIHAGRGPIYLNLDAVRPIDREKALADIKASGTEFRLQRVGMDLTKGGLAAGVLRLESCVNHTIFGGSAGIMAQHDVRGATRIPGLFAAGDVYYSRTIGASYPSFGFGLRNASVTGAWAGWSAAAYAAKTKPAPLDADEIKTLKKHLTAPAERVGGFSPRWVGEQLEHIIFPYYICFVKHGERLNAALTLVEFLKNHLAPKLTAKDAHELRLAHETRNRILSVEMYLRSSLFRTESRTLHFREDYPRRDDADWLAMVKVRNNEGAMDVLKEALPPDGLPNANLPYQARYFLRFPGETLEVKS